MVKNPDEVWVGRDEVNRGNDDMKLSNFNLIKYYKDTTLVVSLKVVENKLQFKTWFELINTDKRSGLLVKRR